MGKTTFSKFLEEKAIEKNSNYLWTSFDKHGSSILKRHEIEHPEVTNPEDRFFAVWGEIIQKFNNSIIETIKSQVRPGTNTFMVDDAKISTEVLSEISKKSLRPEFEINILGIYPDSLPWQVSKEIILPFSFQLIANVCYRVLNRKMHDTVNYTPEKNLQIILSFCILYKGVADIPSHFKKEATFKKMIPLSFHIENHEIDESKGDVKELKELIANVICALKTPFESPMVNGIDELTSLA